MYVSVDFPATFLNSLAAFELAGIGVVSFDCPCVRAGVTGGIDVVAVALGSGSSANRAVVVDSGRQEILGAILETFNR